MAVRSHLQFEIEQGRLLNFCGEPFLNSGLLSFSELTHSKSGMGTRQGGRPRDENRTRPPPWGGLGKCSAVTRGPGARKGADAGKAAVRDPNRGPESSQQPRESSRRLWRERPLFSLSGRSCRCAGDDPHQV
jgi:hypothetical protein